MKKLLVYTETSNHAVGPKSSFPTPEVPIPLLARLGQWSSTLKLLDSPDASEHPYSNSLKPGTDERLTSDVVYDLPHTSRLCTGLALVLTPPGLMCCALNQTSCEQLECFRLSSPIIQQFRGEGGFLWVEFTNHLHSSECEGGFLWVEFTNQLTVQR